MPAFTLFVATFLLAAPSTGPSTVGPAFRLVPDFPKLPSGVTLGGVSGVALDSKSNLFVFHRADEGKDPILVFGPDGAFLRSFGKGMFKSAHGLRIDRDDNVWTTDNANHTVVKFDHDGKVLLSLGERDVPGEDDKHFNRPTDVAVAADGSFFVTDGYGNNRVVKFDKDGKYLMAWGRKGAGEGEFNLPHAVRIDSKGQVYVADRENRRVQVFDQQGKFLRLFAGVTPYGLFITPDDTVFVADGRIHQCFKLSAEGKVLARWGAFGPKPGQFSLPHGITVGADGAVYVTEVNGKRVQKFEPAPASN